VLSSCGENKYLIRVDKKLEKECASNILKIEEYLVAVPISETNTSSTVVTASAADSVSIAVEDVIEEHEEHDGMSSGGEEDPVGNIIEELRIENIGNINESADPNDDEEDINDNLEDEQPETYQDRLNSHRKRIADTKGEKVSITANQKWSEVIWEVIGDHTPPPESQEVKKARDDHMKNVGYVGIDKAQGSNIRM